MFCIFCGNAMKGNLRPASEVDVLCGSCVCILADADQEDLRRAYAKAVEKGLKDKATAIKMFLIEDEIYETKNTKRSMVRKRPLRTARPSHHSVRA